MEEKRKNALEVAQEEKEAIEESAEAQSRRAVSLALQLLRFIVTNTWIAFALCYFAIFSRNGYVSYNLSCSSCWYSM
jgi:uncharacterized membrane protein